MTSTVLTLSPDLPVHQAARLLVRRGLTGAPVVDADGRLVGTVSQLDIVRTLGVAAYGEAPDGTVRDIMHTDVVTAEPSFDLFRLVGLVSSADPHIVPVVSGGRIQGIIAPRELVSALARIYDERAPAHRPTTMDEIAKVESMRNPLAIAPGRGH